MCYQFSIIVQQNLQILAPEMCKAATGKNLEIANDSFFMKF